MDNAAASQLETPSQRQARIRREKRERKILEGGASRLDKITSMSGRPPEQTPLASAQTSSFSDASEAGPSQVESPKPSSRPSDFSNISSSVEQNETEATMRRLLLSTELGSQGPVGVNHPMTNQSRELSNEDPITRMVQQMMGVPTLDAGSASGTSHADGMPPHLAAMLGGGSLSEQQLPHRTPYTYVWKVLHAVSALLLGIYVLSSDNFTGSLTSRLRSDDSAPLSVGTLFWIFVTVELGLQAARYLLEGVRDEIGTIATLAKILPPPWQERLLLAGRYSVIWTTFTDDAMIVVWSLGATVWWRGGLL